METLSTVPEPVMVSSAPMATVMVSLPSSLVRVKVPKSSVSAFLPEIVMLSVVFSVSSMIAPDSAVSICA